MTDEHASFELENKRLAYYKIIPPAHFDESNSNTNKERKGYKKNTMQCITLTDEVFYDIVIWQFFLI